MFFTGHPHSICPAVFHFSGISASARLFPLNICRGILSCKPLPSFFHYIHIALKLFLLFYQIQASYFYFFVYLVTLTPIHHSTLSYQSLQLWGWRPYITVDLRYSSLGYDGISHGALGSSSLGCNTQNSTEVFHPCLRGYLYTYEILWPGILYLFCPLT